MISISGFDYASATGGHSSAARTHSISRAKAGGKSSSGGGGGTAADLGIKLDSHTAKNVLANAKTVADVAKVIASIF